MISPVGFKGADLIISGLQIQQAFSFEDYYAEYCAEGQIFKNEV